MTVPVPTTADFFNSFTQLMQLKNQQDQLKLSQRVQGANMVDLATRVLAGVPKGSRDPVIKALAMGSGLDPEVLRRAVEAMPETPEAITARKIEEGAPGINAGAVASRALAGVLPGQLTLDDLNKVLLSGVLAQNPQVTPQMAQGTATRQLTGLDPGALAQSTAIAGMSPEQQQAGASIQLGLMPNAAQVMGAQEQRAAQQAELQQRGQISQAELTSRERLTREELASRERIAAGAQAMDMLAAQAKQNGGTLTMSGQLEALTQARNIVDALNKGNLTDSAELQYINMLIDSYKLMGWDQGRINTVLKSLNIKPGTKEQLGRYLGINLGNKP
jgi:hypothetical protein